VQLITLRSLTACS